ncbi:tetratricopeptide repeat protein [Streptomyces flavofungini]|uniref:tetratricopeptide repeat protein n=1 Tax=Streptomyces flavofungini TaxID=68200 RepID=UPI0025B05062|nr:tetratricopeptide repeat protein [Streptomyces flavofungini]WJV48092.1 tetratricopeptide repeat protein [Streptomyces flavofungini]
MASDAGRQPSMQELIRLRRRAGFVGRRGELAAFRENFELRPEDERHRFLFHVRGNAGVGKTSLVREMRQLADERGAVTAHVDESVGSVADALGVISAELGRRGGKFKELDRLLVAHRERRYEAESAALAALGGPREEQALQAVQPVQPTQASQSPQPSAGSMAAARAGLAGLGLLPGVGMLAGAVDPAQLAHGADRLRAGLGARLRNQDDVQLVLSPERALTPVFLKELDGLAASAPWVVLFFDTYERTAPFLDGWLCDLMTSERYGQLPANVVVVTAGQRAFDAARWGDYVDFMADVPLEPFTELEARGLLAGKGVVAEAVVEEVLRLSGGLPVLVSTLAENRPESVDDVGDPCASAVERFLKWEEDPVRQAVALACALPRLLDADVFAAAVSGVCAESDVPGLFGWLRGLPFVSERGNRLQYHDVVRAPMLRLQRCRSPRWWAGTHRQLAESFGEWRAEAAAGLDADGRWGDERWRELRLAEMYHRLCSGERGALPEALRGVVEAGGWDEEAARKCADVLVAAGEDADARDVGGWGRDLLRAFEDGGLPGALEVLLDRAGLDSATRALAYAVRGRELRVGQDLSASVTEYDLALAADPTLVRAYYGRALARVLTGAYDLALTDLNRADELAPDDDYVLALRGRTHRLLGSYDAALADLTRAVDRTPDHAGSWAELGETRNALGQPDEALTALDRALRIDPEFLWARVRRARVRRDRGEHEAAVADLDRCVELAPESAWVACERGDALRIAGRVEDSLADYARAIEHDNAYASAYASRGLALHRLDRNDEARAALDRAVELRPDYAWALVHRSSVHLARSDAERALADIDRAKALLPDSAWVLHERAGTLYHLDRPEEARPDLDKLLELDPRDVDALALRGTVLYALDRYRDALTDLSRAVELEPDHSLPHQKLALVHIAMGRTNEALADLTRYVEADGENPGWARRKAAQVHLWCGRPGLALAELAADTGDFAYGDSDATEVLNKAYRITGQWALARRTALAECAVDEVYGLHLLALVVGCAEGVAAARPLWQRAARLTRTSGEPSPCDDHLHVLVAAGLGDWTALDTRLGDPLAAADGPGAHWADLADLADDLDALVRAPGADRARLGPRLARVVAARDAVRARYADPLPLSEPESAPAPPRPGDRE